MHLLLMRGLSRLTPGLLENSNDLDIYWRTGESVLAGRLPYRDFFIEYPPGSVFSFVPPALFADGKLEYIDLFAREMSLVLIATLFITMFVARKSGSNWLLAGTTFAAGAALLYPVAVTRYDAVVALSLALAVLGVALGGRWVYLSYASLGFGAAAKLVPVLAAIPLAAASLSERVGRALKGISVSVVVGLTVCAPALVFGRERFIESLAYQSERGIQVESVWSSVMLWSGLVRSITFDYGAFEVTGPYTDLASAASLPVMAALILLTCAALYWESRVNGLATDSFARYSAALILAFMISSKVISPQYLVWLLPLVPLAGSGVYAVLLSAALVAACWLTSLVFPTYYTDLLNGRFPAPELLLTRNLLLVGLWISLLAPALTKRKRKVEAAA